MKPNFIFKINQKLPKLIIRFVLFFICFFAFLSPIVLDNASPFTRFIMYTGLSNSILVIEYFLLIIFTFLKIDLNQKWVYILRLISTSCIFLTFVVFGFILTPVSIATGEYNPFTVASIFQHFIAPPLAILEFIFLDPVNEKTNKILSLHSLDISFIYLIFIEIRGAVSNYDHVRTGGVFSKYPYFLFDPYFMGVWFEGGNLGVHIGVIPIIIILVGINLLLGFVLVIFKNKVEFKN